MDQKNTLDLMKRLSLSMFRKSFFGIYHGSLSARISLTKFTINKKDAIFDGLQDKDFITIDEKRDYKWDEASIDSEIHLNIYKTIYEAKFIAFAMPPNTVAYSLNHDYIMPDDYFGKMHFSKIKIYDPKNMDDWYERAPYEISKTMIKNRINFLIIRGYGIVLHSRSLNELAKTVALIDNSVKILQHKALS
ncbi:class II aldolase and adducin N-terminal domain-containing protein [Campylobacter corcagiensis]|uniref:Class II aldolase/adducin family protein n=1 Tax=Campylobacter corcagiensis TaxID=1448857 RepID=A0A7M1LEA8_9BACT|nr:class II aldolase and adducin N-terminal domain-containing protein [Campylobacter corcagiensis]QKF65059.1 putative aldolase [Campylobacter corcagiensis]QOQ86790.1 class II aldolase/adducin family protein [Campylobacter corcagiensis]